jgi:acetylornithine deacetylase/succinyl-diaminopimelate desuccinylase-like protein
MRYRVTAKTAGGHSFRDFGAPNAIAKLCGLVAELEKQPLPKVGITTFNFGSISGGTTVNTIAAEASMLYEFRSDTKENFAQLEAQFQAACQGVKDCTLSVETIGVRPCGNVAEEKQAALIARCERAFAGLPVPARYPASTDCNLPLSMGIPAVCIGLVEGGGAHTLAEYIRPESIARGADVLVRLLKSYL